MRNVVACRDWLLPFLQNNQPKCLAKDELRGRRRARTNRGGPASSIAIVQPMSNEGLETSSSRIATVQKGYCGGVAPCVYLRCRAMSPSA